MKQRPAHDYVVLVPEEEESHGGILLPEDCREAAHGSNRDYVRDYNRAGLGTVIGVGPGVYDEEEECFVTVDLKEGMRITYERAAAVEISWPGHKLAVMVRASAVYFEVLDDSVVAELGGLRSREVVS